MKDAIINLVISVGLTLLAGRIKKLKVGKAKELVAIWSGVGNEIKDSLLDDEVTLEEATSLRLRFEIAIIKTQRLLK